MGPLGIVTVTETAIAEIFRFLNSPPGQRAAIGLENVAADLIRLFHKNSKAGDLTNGVVISNEIKPPGAV